MTAQSHGDALAAQALTQIAEVKGQLQVIAQMIQQSNDSTHQRIDDLRHTVETRLTGVEGRLSTLEARERDTALRTAGLSSLVGAASGALVSAGIALLKRG